jgi:predicted  nucleic acid-binding Zn-ribbon protein
MTDIDYIMSDIRDAVGMIISNEANLDDVVDKIRDLVEPEIDKIQEESDKHEDHAYNCEDTIENLEGELEEAREELIEMEADTDWLRLVQMFRSAGGYVHDVTYGQKAGY